MMCGTPSASCGRVLASALAIFERDTTPTASIAHRGRTQTIPIAHAAPRMLHIPLTDKLRPAVDVRTDSHERVLLTRRIQSVFNSRE